MSHDGPTPAAASTDGSSRPCVDGQILTHVTNSIGYITLSRPQKRNALSRQMWRAIPSVVSQLCADDEVNVLVIIGDGTTFSAGADLSDVLTATANEASAHEYCSSIVEALLAVARAPKPTIAQISGMASGGGAEIALATDIRVGDSTAKMQLPMTRLGVVPDEFTLQRLLALVGPSIARSVLFSADAVNAQTCQRVGLINHLVTDTQLSGEVEKLAESFSAGSARSIHETKRLLLGDEMNLDARQLIYGMVSSFTSGDVEKAATAFMHGISP